MDDYVELRGHSEFSVGVVQGGIDKHVKAAADAGMTALCLTEYDSLRGMQVFAETCETAGIRPVYGLEVALVDDVSAPTSLSDTEVQGIASSVESKTEAKKAVRRRERELGFGSFHRLCLRAVTDEGLANLYRLSTSGWTTGLYETPWGALQPRVDWAMLERHSEGIHASSGGTSCPFGARLLAHDEVGAIGALRRLKGIYGDGYDLEIQPHAGAHVRLNRAIQIVSTRLGIGTIATNDCRYVDRHDVDAHTVVLCAARRGMTLEDPKHPTSVPGYHIRGAEEMLAVFRMNHELDDRFVIDAIARTAEIAVACQAKFGGGAVHVPSTGVADPDAQVRKLCVQGWRWRDIPARAGRRGVDPQVYMAQLRHELETISRGGLASYFLVLHDVIGWAREHGIFVGPGRGSSAGSLVCYLLGITSIDPLEHGLMFERFIGPGREKSLPDIDTDFERERREEVFTYLHDRYGDEHVAHIATYGRMHGRSALTDVARVYGLSFGLIKTLTSTFPTRQGDEKVSVREVLSGSKIGLSFLRERPDVMTMVERLEGQIRQVGVHPAGVVVCPIRLGEVCPVETRKRNGVPSRVIAFDMWGVEAAGLLKFDVLGLKNLTTLRCVQEEVRRRGHDLSFDDLPFDDKPTIEAFTAGEYTGIFQYDSQSARSVCEGLTFAGFGDVSALTALNRPGCTRSGLTERFRARRRDPSKIVPVHPIYDAITADTLGVLVYQEQVIRIFRDLAGYTPQEADKMRKIIGKKLGAEEVEKHRERFVTGAVANGMEAEVANGIMDTLLSFASYSFNMAHSVSYATIGYWEMYCRVHHPLEFIWALLRTADDQEEALRYVREARRINVEILPPDVLESGARWTLVPRRRCIRTGLLDIKGVGPKAAESIVGAQMEGPTTLSALLALIERRHVHKGVLTALVKAGAMRSLLPNTRWALESMAEWVDKKAVDVDAKTAASTFQPDYLDADLLSLALSVIPQGTGVHPMSLYSGFFTEDGLFSSLRPMLQPGAAELWLHWSHAYVAGLVIDVAYRRIGDSDVKEVTSQQVRDLKGWGRRYAIMTVEGLSGQTMRIRVDPDAFDMHTEILGRAPGICIVAFVDLYKRTRSARAHYLADLESIRQKQSLGGGYSVWEDAFIQHPIRKYSKKTIVGRRGKLTAPVLITKVTRILDRNESEMAFVTCQDGCGGAVEAVAFSSILDMHTRDLRVGVMADIAFEVTSRGVQVDEEGIVRVLGDLNAVTG